MKPEAQLSRVMAHLTALKVEPITVHSQGEHPLLITVRLRSEADRRRVADSGRLHGCDLTVMESK